MLNSPAVQILLLFGVIITSGLLLTLVNDLITRSPAKSAQTRSSSAHGGKVVRFGQRSYGYTQARLMPSKKSYATVTALRVPSLPKAEAIAAENRDFKVITVRMQNSVSTEAELSRAA